MEEQMCKKLRQFFKEQREKIFFISNTYYKTVEIHLNTESKNKLTHSLSFSLWQMWHQTANKRTVIKLVGLVELAEYM